MDSSFKRFPLSDIRAKDVNQLFKYVGEIGFGTYGRVYKAFSQNGNDQIFALKKLNLSEENDSSCKDGFPITALREIKFLQKLDHKNIIKLFQVVTADSTDKMKGSTKSTFLVFEYMNQDFLGLLNNKINFTLPQIKCIMYQLLQGINYLHSNNIIHRDLKSANILYNQKGEVKIADFGLARLHSKKNNYTNKVVTLWYRAPELLLGSRDYTTQIDLWSLGCFFGELLLGEILFKGDKELKQIELIYQICGSPDELSWPGVKNMPYFIEMGPKNYIPRNLINYFKGKKSELDKCALSLLDNLLTLCPDKRITAEDALNHSFFSSSPLACEISEMPKIKDEVHGHKSNENNNNNKINNKGHKRDRDDNYQNHPIKKIKQ